MTATNFRDLLADTPAVVIDRHRLMRNLERVQAIADEHALDLWPHLKTHKCAEIATLQEHCGAVGFTVAKADEALRFMEAGFKKLLIAYPWLAPQKLARLLAAAEEAYPVNSGSSRCGRSDVSVFLRGFSRLMMSQ